MRHSGGWVKMWRGVWDHPAVQDATDAGLLLWIVQRANWKESRARMDGKVVTVSRGQLLTSIHEMAAALGIARTTLRRKLKWLAECNTIGQKIAHGGTLLTIQNYDNYQSDEDDMRPDDGAPMATERPISGPSAAHQRTHREEEKKQEGKKRRSKKEGVTGALTPASPGSDIWAAYREAYLARYRVEPVRNARTNSQCKQLAERLGLELAQEVVRFYLTHQGAFYVRTSHALGPCVQDAEGLASQFQRGQRVTTTDANKADRNQTNAENFRSVFEELDAEGRLEKWKVAP